MTIASTRLILLTMIISLVQSCRARDAATGASDVKIASGKLVDPSPTNPALAIFNAAGVKVGRCTSSFISNNMVLTAAHCALDEDTGEWVRNDRIKLEQTNPMMNAVKIYPSPYSCSKAVENSITIPWVEKYRRCVASDMVVVEFPENAASAVAAAMGATLWKKFWPVATKLPENGATFLALGYGNTKMSQMKHKLSQTPQLSQGFNTFDVKVQSGQLTVSASSSLTNPNAMEVGMMPGDSGGPLFIEGVIYAITHGGGENKGRMVSDFVATGDPSLREYWLSIRAVNPSINFIPPL